MRLAIALLLLAGAVCTVESKPRPAPGVAGLAPHELFPAEMARHTRLAQKALMARWRTVGPVAAQRASLKPADFGADPTCTKDSTPAFSALLSELQSSFVVGNMSDGIRDLGGAVVDLDGGCYLVSEPVALPQFYGNVHFQLGEIRAAPSFPAGQSLFVVGASPCKTPSGQGSCNENVGFHSVTLDGSHIAGACLQISATMGAVLDSSSAVFGFTTAGIFIDGGHEVMVSDTWVAAYFWSSPLKEKTNTTGILVAGNDHYVSDTIVFSARVGVELTGAANILSGVHTWNCATSNGGVGIVNKESQNRFIGVYLDYTHMLLVGSAGANVITVSGGFFLGGAAVVFVATTPTDSVRQVALIGNEWAYSGNTPYMVNETAGTWVSVTDLTVSGTAAWNGQAYAGPAATKLASNQPAGSDVWQFDFADVLLFPGVAIDPASVDVQVLGDLSAVDGAAPAAVANLTGQTVSVYAQGTGGKPFSVRVAVSQSKNTGV